MAMAELPQPDCFAQPFWFGVPYSKKTLYWLSDNLPILTGPDGAPVWENTTAWTDASLLRERLGARKAILGFGASACVAAEAADKLAAEGIDVDAWSVNGLPLSEHRLESWFNRYPDGIVTIEDGLIGTLADGIRGFAGLVRTAAFGKDIPLRHLGITDPRVAPSEGHLELWRYFGIDTDSAITAVKSL